MLRPVAGFVAIGPEVRAGVLSVAEELLAGAGCDDERMPDGQVGPWLDRVAAGEFDAMQATIAALDRTALRWVEFRNHWKPAS
jgi:hypothetical protein